MNKGFLFSFEALISLLLFSLLIISFETNEENYSFKELIALKKANDLLKVWSYYPDILTIESDTKMVFDDHASVFVDDIKIVESKFSGESISTNAEIIDSLLIKRNIRIIVYFN
jgi:hypothetical protein